MIITRTPFRISFVGGGSDLESFYKNSNGAVLSTAINKYIFITSHKYFLEDSLRIKYSKTETVSHNREINHPIFRQVFEDYNITKGLEFSSTADLPAGTGLGSSSSFTVCLLQNIFCRLGLDYKDKQKLAEVACSVEIDKLNEPIGKQDQYIASFGGFNVIQFLKNNTIKICPLNINKEILNQLNQNLVLFYTGIRRKSSSILKEQKNNLMDDNTILKTMKMVELVWNMKSSLESGELRDFGGLLNENWNIKKTLASKISNPELDEIYDIAISKGALGGKLLGAGGGGFFLFYVPPKNKKKLMSAFCKLRELEFKFHSSGTELLFNGE